MTKEQQKEYDYIMSLHNESNYEEHIEPIKILLKELARRLMLWTRMIEEKNPDIELGTNILIDVAFLITGNKVELPKIDDVVMSYFDKLILASYFNWENEKNILNSKGYALKNPYIPFIEMFKLGACCLKYQYTKLEVYPFMGIIVSPEEDYLVDTPFWSEDII